MTFNRFDFLELNEQGMIEAPATVVDEDGPIRFSPPSDNMPFEAPIVRRSGGLEEEVVYQRRCLRVMEVFGSRGTIAGAFNYPTGLAVDRSGIMFIADSYNHRLQRITSDGGVSIVGGRGTSHGQFVAPMGVAIDEDRSFYVVEQGNCRVQKFSTDGKFQFAIGREGSRLAEFRSPTGIVVAPGSKNIYVADTGNARVQCFNHNGELIHILGAADKAHPRLTNPQAVACDRNGNVYVADTLAHKIMRFDPAGRFSGTFGGAPSPNNHMPDLSLTEPHALCFDERGRLYIADGPRTEGRISALSPESGTMHTVLENVGRGLGHLARPGGIACSPIQQSKTEHGCERGDIYVSDTMNHRILRFVWS